MKNFIKIFFIVLILNVITNSTSALENKFPDALQKTPNLIGASELKFLGLKVYDIYLWSENANFSYNKIFAIQIKYKMNFSREDLVKRSISEIRKLHEISASQEKSYSMQLTEVFNSVKKGDEKIAVFDPSQGVLMFHNNQFTGKISDLKLARFFVDIWLDENGSYPKITRKILGKN